MTRKLVMPWFLNGDSYTFDQIEMITENLSERNGFAIKLCSDAGLRAFELATLHLVGQQFRVIGKGELIRDVWFSEGYYDILLRKKRQTPIEVKDRGKSYLSHFDIAYGSTVSASIFTASKRILGWTAGVNGLRRTWAQNRYESLSNYFPYPLVIKIIKFQLGEVGTGIQETPSYESLQNFIRRHDYNEESISNDARDALLGRCCFSNGIR